MRFPGRVMWGGRVQPQRDAPGIWWFGPRGLAAPCRSFGAAMRLLRQDGPTLGRPFVDRIEMSRHANMKELRVRYIRILFAFDPKRQTILLLGGNKEGKWDSWYDEQVPRADLLFDRHLARVWTERENEVKHAKEVQRDRRRNRGKS
ncbi:MAG: type II toxin-antitoxin system RelE/ParE family toxin [Chloroflexota bacterium]